DRAGVDRARWLLGVCLGAAGRYCPALDALAPLLRNDLAADGSGARPALPALAAATAASLHRQLGRHAAARTLDRHARDLTGLDPSAGAQPDLAAACFDAELGLAADAVGLGETDAARAHLEQAQAVRAVLAGWRGGGRPGVRDACWRQEVRLAWVRAEVGLLTGRTDLAVEASRAALAAAEAAGAPRHVAKSALFLGVAQREAGQPAAARAGLRRAAALAAALDARPLCWPAHAVLAELELAEGGGAGRSRADAHRRAAGDVVQAIAADLPADLAADWLSRPDLRALLATG
ncbi:MAG TPA: hypothetical protein VFS29_07045, partial [Motilibacteraceae bacterium]|nr:hypothetical protein [Motilibacteraceae bacterium]